MIDAALVLFDGLSFEVEGFECSGGMPGSLWTIEDTVVPAEYNNNYHINPILKLDWSFSNLNHI